MMDCVVPGGVAVDLAADGAAAICATWCGRARAIPATGRTLRQHRLACRTAPSAPASLSPSWRAQFGAGGYVGRASGRDFDAPRPALSALRRAALRGPALRRGRRQRARLGAHQRGRAELGADRPDSRRPAGRRRSAADCRRRPAARAGDGRGIPRRRLRLAAARRRRAVARCHLRDPSWFQWPLLEAAIEGNIVADFPLCNKSFNCSYSGARPLRSHAQDPAGRPAARAAHRSRRPTLTMPNWRRWRALDAGRAPAARPQPVDPSGGRRLLQRLRTGDQRAGQRLLRPGAVRPALRRLAAPRRRAAGHRAGDAQHARGAGADL